MCYNSYSFLLCRKGGFSPLICIKFFMSKIFFNFSMICLDAIHFVLILLGVLSRLVFVINFGKVSLIVTSNNFSVPFCFCFFFLLVSPLNECYTICNCLIVLGYSVFFTLLFSLHFSFWSFY